MDNIYEANRDFQFNQITLISPTSVGGGTHFSKLFINKHPLYIQTPKCFTKQGIVKSGKKMYADLVFTHDDEEFIQWLETLETTVRKILFDNRAKWFDIDLTEEDIENYFAPTIKLFKSGKMYLVRVNANSKTSGAITVSNMKIYDENEQTVEIDAIDDKTSMITIVEIQGVKCSSKSFQIEIEIKQIMVLKPIDLFQKCIIKSTSVSNLGNSSSSIGNPEQNHPLLLQSLKDNVKQDVNPDIKQDYLEENIKIASVSDSESINAVNNNASVSQKELLTQPPQTDDKCLTSEKEEDDREEPIILDGDISEIELNFDNLEQTDTFHLKEKTEVYYEMYREARRKAKLAKSLALSSFMEARRIKNLYMLDDIDDSDSDLDDLEESIL